MLPETFCDCNVLPLEEQSIEVDYDPTDTKDINSFKEILIKMYNIYTNVRTEKGGDIASACGQLVVKKLQQQKEYREKKKEEEEQKNRQLNVVDALAKMVNYFYLVKEEVVNWEEVINWKAMQHIE